MSGCERRKGLGPVCVCYLINVKMSGTLGKSEYTVFVQISRDEKNQYILLQIYKWTDLFECLDNERTLGLYSNLNPEIILVEFNSD